MSDVLPGRPATHDPKDAHLTAVSKRGDWYRVEGTARGERISVDIHARDVEPRTRRDAEALMRRSVLGVADQQRSDRR